MPRTFNIPRSYRSPLLSKLKTKRNEADPRKRDKSPTVLELEGLTIKFARHFGFCFGVENAIEIAYRALEENPGKKIYLLSEMIHNPQVNGDLEKKGIQFLFSTYGEERIPLDQVTEDDIVVVPAFGTTRELFDDFARRGIDTREYNTTCPFVEKVWKRARQLGESGHSIIIHGKHRHEETRATFSHASLYGPSLIIAGIEEAQWLAEYILGKKSDEEFLELFEGRFSKNFDPKTTLKRIGVVNQTTMLATETYSIATILKEAVKEKVGEEKLADHFADTRDTLCYATSENQEATKALIASGGDIALVVGGYNSSNTSHLVELCDEVIPSYFIKDADELISLEKIRHLDIHDWKVKETEGWYISKPQGEKLTVIITAGASCPDSLVHSVVERLIELHGVSPELLPGAVEGYLTTIGTAEPEPESLRVVS